KTLHASEIVTADGMPVIWSAKLLGSKMHERVTGADLVPKIAEEASSQISFYILGGRPEVNQQAIRMLQTMNPELRIVGSDSSMITVNPQNPLQEEPSDREIIKKINQSQADILLLAMGNPKQEYWFYKNRSRLQVPVSMGIGGTLDFLAGNIKRAPLWMQKTGMEWIYRFIQEPKRMWKRYSKDLLLFGSMISLPILYYQYKRMFSKSKSIICQEKGNILKVQLPEIFESQICQQLEETLSTKMLALELDFQFVRTIDNFSLAYLYELKQRYLKREVALQFTKLSRASKKYFHWNRLWLEFATNIQETSTCK
ncbi:MAG: WecB/TagA/CpsF family glycosyltransferase, partial [Spirochaetota bacterium]